MVAIAEYLGAQFFCDALYVSACKSGLVLCFDVYDILVIIVV